MTIIIFFDLGIVVFFIVIMAIGLSLFVQDMGKAAIAAMQGRFVNIVCWYFVFIIILSIIYYISYLSENNKKFKKGNILGIIFWIITNILSAIPLLSVVFLSIIPQFATSLLNMLFSVFILILASLGLILIHLKGLEICFEVDINKENAIPIQIVMLGTAIVEFLVAWFINLMVIRNTSLSIYDVIYGEKMSQFIEKIFL